MAQPLSGVNLTEELETCISNVDLGFAEKSENAVYLSHLFFPSKLGGRPAWLRWNSLPSSATLKCGNCGKQVVFLCQIYVPTELSNDSDSPKLHHRTIYLFCCRNGPCSADSSFIKCIRTQRLQTKNDDIYEKESDIDKLSKVGKEIEQLHKLCQLCGCLGDKTCSSCHNVSYCSKDHQSIDWKYRHKKECNKSGINVNNNDDTVGKNPLLFNEYEIVIEEEPPEDTNKKKEMNSNIELCDRLKPKDAQLEKDLLKLGEEKVDEYFLNFRERIEREPEQIVRYDLGGEPLWVSGENIPSNEDIPDCRCGAKRQFEFQILPQMINYLGIETTVNSMDWGGLYVYTCVDNCSDGDAYKEEFVWKQDFSAADVLS